MFDKIFEFLRTIWTHLVPYCIITEMELGCVLRFGRYSRVLTPGIHLKIPFADSVYAYHVKTCTSHLAAQTLTTKDGKSIVLKAIVRYNIFDIKLYTIEVYDAFDAINDTVQGIICELVCSSDWKKIQAGIQADVVNKAKVKLREWGIDLEKITLSDMAEIQTTRIMNSVDPLQVHITKDL